MANAPSGLMAGIRSLFKGSPKQIRSPLAKSQKDIFTSYPQQESPEKRIIWLLDQFYFQAQYEKLQLHRKWFRNHLFFCLDGETTIHLLDNRDVTLRELAKEIEPVWSYGFDTRQGRIVPVQIEKCWSTGKKECIEIEIDSGAKFICTKDHRILTWWNGYVEAGHLRPGDRLVPLYRSGRDAKYGGIFQPLDCRWESEHRWVATEIFGSYPKGKHVHHKNDHKRDNRPENLQVVPARVHGTMLSKDGRKRISVAKKKFWNQPGNREKQSERISREHAEGSNFSRASRISRETPEFRAHQSKRMSQWWAERRNKLATEQSLKNHRVIAIREVGLREVYDVTVPKTSNVALACGIFVHNCGYHDNVLSDTGMSFDSIGVNQAEYSFAANDYRAYIRYGAAMYVQTAPEFIAQPTSADIEAQGVAEAARATLEFEKENIGYDAIRAMEATNLRIYGNSFRYVYYSVDPRYGFVTAPVFEDVEAQIDDGSWSCPQCGMSGEGQQMVCPTCGPGAQLPVQLTAPTTAKVPKLQGKVVYPKGQEVCEVVWPFEVYVRSSVKTLWQAPYLLRVRMVDTPSLHATYPKADFGASGTATYGSTETTNTSEDIGLIYQQAIPELPSDPTQYPGWYERAVTQAKTTLIQGWIRPNQYFFDEELRNKFPDGLYGAKADDCLLESRNESMDDHWTHFKHIHVEGRFWGDGDDDLLPDQMLVDEVDRLILRHVDYNTLPVLLADTQKLDKNNVINDAGYMIEVKNLGQRNLDQVAKWLPGGQLSPDVWNWRGAKKQDMQFHSGISPASMGQHVPGIDTFGGQQTAIAQNQQMLGPLQLMYREEEEKWAGQMTKLACENWLDDRVQATMGSNGTWEFKKLRGEMLKPGSYVWKASIIPLDPTKQQSFTQAIAAGAFNPQLPQVVQRKILELWQLSPDLNDYNEDAKVQQKEIEGGKQTGQFPQPIAFVQNDQAHLATLKHWMNSDDYDAQPAQVKVGAYNHFLQHMQNQATMMAAQGAMQGAHAEAGGQNGGGNNNQNEQENKNNNSQFRQERAQKGQAAKPHTPQPPGGNQHAVGPRGQSHSAQQKRRNGHTR